MYRFLTTALIVVLVGQTLRAQTPLPAAPASSGGYQFRGETGLLVFHVRSERTQDFEHVFDRIARGFETTTSAVRLTQAEGWRVYRSDDTREAAIYVMVLDPVVSDADYDPVRMLTELAPDQAQSLYERLRTAVIRVERLDLRRIQ